jgi:sortase (surface protein transpeptidase)
VTLPSIGVTSPLEHLARQDDGTIAAPVDFDMAGWFSAGPQPGQPGPAVIAGHVDSKTGPAVFYRLRDLQPGDPVEVRREDGRVVTFRVTRLEQHAKDEFPSEAVYGPVPDAELRLITCGGEFDRSSGHYLDNLVVFAVAT